MIKRGLQLIGLFALVVLLNSCAFQKLKKDLAAMESQVGIGGIILNRSPQPGPLIVLLYAEKEGAFEIRSFKVLEAGETLYFFLVTPGDYFILAFEDDNGNLAYDDGEFFGHYGKPDRIRLSLVSAIDDLNFEVARTSGFPQEFSTDIATTPDLENVLGIAAGTVTTLDDPKFSQENASKGFWQPITALKELGAGVYFLEPYDPEKIPILFVHGAAGSPRNFQPLAERIDRRRFQPWFVYYPSGFRLMGVSRFFNNLIEHLHERYRFDTLYVTAHSMGGLLSRAFILQNVFDGGNDYIKLFVSISAPFGGMETAQKGVEGAPAAIPSWHDLVPGSDFIEYIFSRNLSDTLDYYLLFSYRGDCSLFMGNNDGSVTLRSQLDLRAQHDALEKWGFDEGHVTILSSPAFLGKYDEILATAAGKTPGSSGLFGLEGD